MGWAEFKPSHYALRYRDQKAARQTNKAPAWAEPLPSMAGRLGGRECAVMSKLPLLPRPVRQVLSSLQTLWPIIRVH